MLIRVTPREKAEHFDLARGEAERSSGSARPTGGAGTAGEAEGQRCRLRKILRTSDFRFLGEHSRSKHPADSLDISIVCGMISRGERGAQGHAPG